MKIAEIQLGHRVRKDMGDLAKLSESMKRHGLLHPVVVKSDGTLIAGQRRIEAAKLIGWTEIPVTQIDVLDLLSATRDENAERKNFTPSEAVAIGLLIEKQERPKAQERKRLGSASARGGRGKTVGVGLTPTAKKPVVADIAANAVGMSRPTFTQAKEIIAAAEADPAQFGDLPLMMDETNIGSTHRELRHRKGYPERHRALYKLSYAKPNREVERAIVTLDGICHCLCKLLITQLDPNKKKNWSKALKKSASEIHRFARRLDHDN